MNKSTLPLLVVLLFFCRFHLGASAAYENPTKAEETYMWDIYVCNMVTEAPVPDTLTVDLLRPDSTLIFSQLLTVFPSETGMTRNYARFNVPGSDFIVRLSHPDYETAWHKVHVDREDLRGRKLLIRKLTKGEKARMLDEVVVTASVVEIVNKGDTVQFNADAFELAEGSMLSALIKRLPGAELKANGQIYVNGRFVNKLLLDGKDFFEGDKLVLLQNLPAYTVRNIQVYEQTLPWQLARKQSHEPDLVMDVKLKKDFNAGWLANAEAGGGTHHRYRLRGFGLVYNTRSRYAAYALANNLNETGSPDMSGDWQKPSNQQNEIITRGGGFDYRLQPKEKLSFRGSATVQYRTIFGNTLVNQQNYIPQGDNYSRRWSDSRTGTLDVHTIHTASFDRDKANHDLQATFDYGSDKLRSNVTEGTFGNLPGDYPAMRRDLQAGMPDTLDILNRYLSMMNAGAKRANGNFGYHGYFDLGKGFSLSTNIDGTLFHRWSEEAQHYLLQYAAQDPQTTRRVNPQDMHGYKLHAYLSPYYDVKKWHTSLTYTFDNDYSYSNTMFYDLVESSESRVESCDPLSLLGMSTLNSRLSTLNSILDAQNSYTYGLHALEQSLEYSISYNERWMDETGTHGEKLQISLSPKIRYLRRKMDFKGFNSQVVQRNTWMPEMGVWFKLTGRREHQMQFKYTIESHAPLMMDLLDIAFDSDPLNPTVGNPGLKYSFTHAFKIDYQSRGFLWNKLWIWASWEYNLRQNNVSYGTTYDIATGIRTTRPLNVNGNRDGLAYLSLIYKPDRRGRFKIDNSLAFTPERFVNYISTDEHPELKKSVSHSERWYDRLKVDYQHPKFTVGVQVSYQNQRVTSRTGDFDNYTLQHFSYGLKGLVRLPLGFEVSTNIDVARRYGFSDPVLDKAQVIWNARISKSIMHGNLQFAFDGYDMLQQVKRINYSVTSSYRRETRVNSVPSYFMFTVKYFFAKKPRQ